MWSHFWDQKWYQIRLLYRNPYREPPTLGPEFGSPVGHKTDHQLASFISDPEVGIFYEWAQWQHDVALQGKEVVYVNIDETAVQKSMLPRKGYMLFKANTKKTKSAGDCPPQ